MNCENNFNKKFSRHPDSLSKQQNTSKYNEQALEAAETNAKQVDSISMINEESKAQIDFKSISEL